MRQTAAYWSRSMRAIFARPRSIFWLATFTKRTKNSVGHETTFDALIKDMIEADLTAIPEEYNRSHHDD